MVGTLVGSVIHATVLFLSSEIIKIIIIIRQFVRRRNMSVKSLQGRRTEHATRIKLHNVETGES